MSPSDQFSQEADQLLTSLPSGAERLAARHLIRRRLVEAASNTADTKAAAGQWWMPALPNCWSLLALVTAVLLARLQYKLSSPDCLISGSWTMELSRLPSNCSSMCAGLTSVPVEVNISAERFTRLYAYSGRPVVVKNGTSGWLAHRHFSYEFIRDMHDRHPSAYGDGRSVKVIDPFNVELATLREALHMSEERRRRPFYFGWKNLNRGIFKELLQYHSRPYYLGPEIEHPAADWFYMGTASRAALLHIDFFSRPSWQAQIAGRKRWDLHPPVECESVCSPLQVDLEPGDILNVDPNQWYHATYVLNGSFSITLGSEFM